MASEQVSVTDQNKLCCVSTHVDDLPDMMTTDHNICYFHKLERIHANLPSVSPYYGICHRIDTGRWPNRCVAP